MKTKLWIFGQKSISFLIVLSLLLPVHVAWGNGAVNRFNTDFEKSMEMMTAPCQDAVYYLLEKQPAPCTGYLFSPQMEFKARLAMQTNDDYQEYINKQQALTKVLKERVSNLEEYNNKLSQRVTTAENLNFWKSTGFFVLGILVTGAIAKNVK